MRGSPAHGRGRVLEGAVTTLPLGRIEAVIFDLDGVITDTASIHEDAWAQTFDAFLAERHHGRGPTPAPFSSDDYRQHVDGRSRIDGAEGFLRSRDIVVPRGAPDDPPGHGTVSAIAAAKNRRFLALLEQQGGLPYPTTITLIEQLRARAVRVGVISASRNCDAILRAAGIRDLFDVKVDGVDADERGLPGKPDPAVFLEAARALGVEPRRAAVVEDSIAGVEAGRRGGFAMIIGVDRAGYASALLAAGATSVVGDLGELALG